MPRMGKHSPTEAAGKRARVCAWLVFISMAGTTMSFQVYHSIEHGHMPWPLAVLYGIVPLLISMLVIEFASGRAQWAAYLLMGGAMYLSAAATGSVVLRAAPPHSSLLFGLILDGAAILAARFLMTAVKRAASAELAAARSALEGERSARLEVDAECAALREEGGTAQQERAELAARLEAALQQQAQAAQGRHKGGTDAPKPPRHRTASAARKGVAKDPLAQAAEAITREQAKIILRDEPGISGSELGRRLEVQPGYGRRLKRELTQASSGGEG